VKPVRSGLAVALLLAMAGCGREEAQHVDEGAGAALEDLPLVEVPASAGDSDTLAFIASGDGGWARLVREVSDTLSAAGVPVVGLNALRYYWQPRSPDESARALERILRSCLARWDKERILLVGYSRGAGVLPFMASRLPADLLERVDVIAFLGLEPTIGFQFHYADWLLDRPRADAVPVQPEVEKLRGRRLLCIYGAEEPDSLCPKLSEGLVTLDRRAGGHHFDGDYAALAKRILQEAAAARGAEPGPPGGP
jgi:type IV secretory pathway VirJ component